MVTEGQDATASFDRERVDGAHHPIHAGTPRRFGIVPASELDREDRNSPVDADERAEGAGGWIAHRGLDPPARVGALCGRDERLRRLSRRTIEVHERPAADRVEDDDQVWAKRIELASEDARLGLAERRVTAIGRGGEVRCREVAVEVDAAGVGPGARGRAVGVEVSDDAHRGVERRLIAGRLQRGDERGHGRRTLGLVAVDRTDDEHPV